MSSITPILLSVLADPMRQRIVAAIGTQELPVAQIAAQVAISQSGVSRHLRILHAAGVVRMRPDAQRRLYALRPEPFIAMEDWMQSYRALWDARLDRFAAALTKAQLDKNKEDKT